MLKAGDEVKVYNYPGILVIFRQIAGGTTLWMNCVHLMTIPRLEKFCPDIISAAIRGPGRQ
jgi:hypothetical protein